jgi:N-acetylmuramoyl-L-alanine amidase
LFESRNSVVAARLAVLAPVRAPAVIVETGYLTNEDDQQLLASPGFQERVADSISNAIIRFLK